jgi:hypothetical protein
LWAGAAALLAVLLAVLLVVCSWFSSLLCSGYNQVVVVLFILDFDEKMQDFLTASRTFICCCRCCNA